MRNFKKFLTLVLAVMMVVSSMAFTTSAAVTKFEDVDADNEALVKAVDLLSYMGIAKGKSETNFGADELVTREQFALFMYRLMKGGKEAPTNAGRPAAFTDCEDPTYFFAIDWAESNGIVKGKGEKTFAPKDSITLQEAYTMVVRALEWDEDETLRYPHGFIEVAEQEGVTLDAGLSSEVGYGDALTRGDMAIILYNAFFAETGIPEVYEEFVGDGTLAGTKIVEKKNYKRLCEKSFDVHELVFEVAATPHYQLADAEVEATYDLGYEAMWLQLVEDNDVNEEADVAPAPAYFTAEDLGLAEGTLDEYFLGEFTLFVKLDKDEEEVEKVLFADCNMDKTTSNEIKLPEISSTKVEAYYVQATADGEVETDAKILSGEVVVGGETMYVYNAPYTYANNAYSATLPEDYDDVDVYRYDVRNEENVEAISFTGEEVEEGVWVYTAEVEEIIADEYLAGADDKFYTEYSDALIEYFLQAYYGGLYEATIYDVNGDGLYDYIDYQEYSIFTIENDEDEDFEFETSADKKVLADVDHLYVNEEVVVEGEYANEDLVIGYVDFDNNYVKVAEVVKPVVSSIDYFSTANGTITLANGDVVDVINGYRVVNNSTIVAPVFYGDDTVVFDAKLQGEELVTALALEGKYFDRDVIEGDDETFYVYNGVLLAVDGVDETFKFAENLIIPTTLGGEKEPFFDREMVNGKVQEVVYIYAYVDGEAGYIPVETENVYYTIISDRDALTTPYEDQLCTYEMDGDLYVIKPLAENAGAEVEDEDLEYVFVNEDVSVLDEKEDEDQVIGSLASTYLTKKGSNYYFGLEVAGNERAVTLQASTKIIIRVDPQEGDDADEYDYKELTVADLTDDLENELTNVQYIVANNTASKTKEKLVVLYAEAAEELSLATEADKDAYRIVKNYDIKKVEEDKWINIYELYNPMTGEVETNVPGTAEGKKASSSTLGSYIAAGTLITLTTDGEVQDIAEKKDDYIVADLLTAPEALWVGEYDAAEGYIALVPTIEEECKDCVAEYVEGAVVANPEVKDIEGNVIVDGDDVATNYVLIDKDTSIVYLSQADFGTSSFFKWGSMGALDASVFADPDEDYLCYNKNAVDKKGQRTTGYADFVKVWVSLESKTEEGEYPTADFIIVLVNGGEAAAKGDLECGEDH